MQDLTDGIASTESGTPKPCVAIYIRPARNPRKAEIVQHYLERERATSRDPDEPFHPDESLPDNAPTDIQQQQKKKK